MVAAIFVYINIFIVATFGLTMMFSNFSPLASRNMIIGSILLVILPILFVAFMNVEGEESHWISDLIFMRGGSIGIPVVIGYGIGFGLLLSKLRALIFGKKIPEENGDQ